MSHDHGRATLDGSPATTPGRTPQGPSQSARQPGEVSFRVLASGSGSIGRRDVVGTEGRPARPANDPNRVHPHASVSGVPNVHGVTHGMHGDRREPVSHHPAPQTAPPFASMAGMAVDMDMSIPVAAAPPEVPGGVPAGLGASMGAQVTPSVENGPPPVARSGRDILTDLVREIVAGVLSEQLRTGNIAPVAAPVAAAPMHATAPQPSGPISEYPEYRAHVVSTHAAAPTVGHAKAPMPDSITSSLLSEAVQQPHVLRLSLEAIFDHLQRGRTALEEFPSLLMAFIKDFSGKQWAATWLRGHALVQPEGASPAELRAQFAAWREAFIEAFVHFTSGVVRAPNVIALEELMSGQVRQGDEPAAKYAERFLIRARLLPEESQLSLCKYFLAGLRPPLRRACCLDRENREWTALHTLVQYVYAEEVRLNQSRASFPVRMQEEENRWQPPSKRPRTQGQAAPVVSVATEVPKAMKAVSPPSGPLPPAPPDARDRPFDQCPVYGLVTSAERPMTKEERACCGAWGGCFNCRMGRHRADECPRRPQDQRGRKPNRR